MLETIFENIERTKYNLLSDEERKRRENRSLDALKSLGVSDPKPYGSGVIPGKEPAGSLIVESITSTDTTIPLHILKSKLPVRNLYESIKLMKPYTRTPLMGCVGQLRGPCRWQYKTVPPEIKFGLLPEAISGVKVHFCPWDLRVEGNVVIRLENNSKEAKEGKKRAYEEEWHWEIIEGTANLTNNSDTISGKAVDAGKTIFSNISHKLSDLMPGQKASASAHFKKSGAWDFITSIFSILLSGTIKTSGGIDAKVHYEFPLDEIQTKSRHIDYNVRLPVRGDVGWVW